MLAALIVVGVASVVFVHEVATHRYDIEGYKASADGQLTIGYTYGECEMFRKAVLVEETDERVVVAVTYMPELWPGGCRAIGYEGVATFQLEDSLGERKVFYDDGEEYVNVPTDGRPPRG